MTEIGEAMALIRKALEQGNAIVAVDGEVADLTGTALHGLSFDPIELPTAEPDDPDAPPPATGKS